VDPVKIAVLLAGAFFLVFGLAAYRHFYTALGATAGLAVWMAFKDTLIKLPGLREHPGTASILILVLLLLTGIFFASRFSRILAFFSGLGTGLILSQAVSTFLVKGTLPDAAIRFSSMDAMDILVGLIGGILFILFERAFAVLLTSVVGSLLCTWAIGGQWTFPGCLVLGLVAQPLVFKKLKLSASDAAGMDRSGSTKLMVFALALFLPAHAFAGLVIGGTNPTTSRAVIATGWRDGVRVDENHIILDKRGSMVAEIVVGKAFPHPPGRNLFSQLEDGFGRWYK
jgi:hypothetical protein